MMQFLRMMITGDRHPPLSDGDEAILRELQQERGEFRQSIQRVASGSRLMMSWEGVGQMMKDVDDA